jgi:hypothetical protein
MEHFIKEGKLDELLIVFSPINIPSGKFGFSRYFKDDERTILFFNCQNTWYVDCIEEMLQIVENTLQKFSPLGVVFYGASMGGYAAARIGGMYPQYPTFLFGPEVRLYIEGSLSWKHATIKNDNVDLNYYTKLDFSNTVVLFGIYEPIDLIQYKESINLGFFTSIPIKSPHAVHEEFYYRNTIRSLSNSRTCKEFVSNIPQEYVDCNPPTDSANLLYNTYFQKYTSDLLSNSGLGDFEQLLSIDHPAAYWVILRDAGRTRNKELLISTKTKLLDYFNFDNSSGFEMPEKIQKEIVRWESKL